MLSNFLSLLLFFFLLFIFLFFLRFYFLFFFPHLNDLFFKLLGMELSLFISFGLLGLLSELLATHCTLGLRLLLYQVFWELFEWLGKRVMRVGKYILIKDYIRILGRFGSGSFELLINWLRWFFLRCLKNSQKVNLLLKISNRWHNMHSKL